MVGGGITALAAAHRLREIDPALEMVVLEAGERLGGVIATQRRGGFLVERGPDMFTTRQAEAIDLCHRLGLADQVIDTNAQHRRALIVRGGRLYPVPAGFTLMAPVRMWPVLTTPVLSIGGKLRLAWEYFVPARREGGDESLASFARRRLGRQAFERLVQPLIGGIYTADAEKLSMAAAMPEFVELEQKYGGLIRGARRGGLAGRSATRQGQGSGARYGLFVSLREGLESLVTALAARLPASSVRLQSPVSRIARSGEGGWELEFGTPPRRERFGAVIVATGAPAAARLLAECAPELSAELASIEYAGVAIVTCAYRRDQFAHPLDAFGVVVPLVEKRKILSVSLSSVKFPGRAPEGSVLLRIFLGGACQPEVLELDDAEMLSMVERELGELLGATGKPLWAEAARWRGAMPQYHVGHLERVERIRALTAQQPGLQLAGNQFTGVGLPQCIRSGEEAAQRIVDISLRERIASRGA